MNGLTDVNPEKFFKFSKSRTRGHPLKVQKSHCRLELRKNFYSQRVSSDKPMEQAEQENDCRHIREQLQVTNPVNV